MILFNACCSFLSIFDALFCINWINYSIYCCFLHWKWYSLGNCFLFLHCRLEILIRRLLIKYVWHLRNAILLRVSHWMKSFMAWRTGWVKNSICFLFILHSACSLPTNAWFTYIHILSLCFHSWVLMFWLSLKNIVISTISIRLVVIALELNYVLRGIFNKWSIIQLLIKETCFIFTLLLLHIVSCCKLFSALDIKLADLVFFKELFRDLFFLEWLINWGLVAFLFIWGNTTFIHYECWFYLLLHLLCNKS